MIYIYIYDKEYDKFKTIQSNCFNLSHIKHMKVYLNIEKYLSSDKNIVLKRNIYSCDWI